MAFLKKHSESLPKDRSPLADKGPLRYAKGVSKSILAKDYFVWDADSGVI
jgi:hypothetical protein